MFKKLLLILMLIAPMSIMAQNFAHFDLNGTVEAMPEYKTAMTELQALGQQYQKNIQDMQKELQAKAEKYQKEQEDAEKAGKPLPEVILKRQQSELQTMYQKLQQAGADNEKAFQQEQAKKMQPITQKVLDAVGAIAKEGNYVYVIDIQAARANSIFINEKISVDVTSALRSKLGIK